MRRSKRTDVCLANMPFGPFTQPSIGLSLIRAALPPSLRSEIEYFNLDFAATVGGEFYLLVSNGFPRFTDLVGDWIFAPATFGPDDARREETYLRDVFSSGTEFESARSSSPEARSRREFVDSVLRAREVASAFVDACAQRVVDRAPRVVGVTSTFQQNMASIALAQRIKTYDPSVLVVLGGANCEGAMGKQLVRTFPCVDAVVSGEGEIAFPRIVESFLRDGSVPNLTGVYTASGDMGASNAPSVPHLDDVPLPDYSDFLRQWRESPITAGYEPTLLFETSRGCWWGERNHCTFCGLNGSTMRYRSKSAGRALAELRTIVDEYRRAGGTGAGVGAVDNILDMAYFRDFLPALAQEQTGLQLFYEVKANLRKEQVQLLRDAGVTRLQPGIESLSTPVLTAMRKGVRAIQNVQLLKWCKELGVAAEWNLLYGFPGENEAEYERMADLIPRLFHLRPPIGAGRIRLDRFSPNFDGAADVGFVDVRPYPAYTSIYRLEPDVISNIAYFFSYEYADGRDVEHYTTRMRENVAAWRREHDASDLVWTTEGDALRILDSRGTAERATCTLYGIARDILMFCDAARSVDALEEHLYTLRGATPSDVAVALDELDESGYIMRERRLVLSLVIKLGPYRLKPGAVRRFRTWQGAMVAPEADPSLDQSGVIAV